MSIAEENYITSKMRYFILILLIPIFTKVYSQCEGNPLEYLDANGEKFTYHKLDSLNLTQFYYLNGTLSLCSLYEPAFTNEVQNSYNGTSPKLYNLQSNDSPRISSTWPIDTCVTCYSKKVKIIDSIDVNKDGVKELFLYREWYCTAPYYHSIPHNSQRQSQRLSQYEVWDIQSNRNIFQVKNRCESSIPFTVNVMNTVGYSFDLLIKKNGSISAPNWTKHRRPYDNNPEEINEAVYVYNFRTKKYEKK